MGNLAFPGASHTFTITRRMTTVDATGYNTISAGFQPVATGVPVSIKANTGIIKSTDSGPMFASLYHGSTWNKYDIRLGDLLADQTENDLNGNPVMYEVQGVTHNYAINELELKRTEVV